MPYRVRFENYGIKHGCGKSLFLQDFRYFLDTLQPRISEGMSPNCTFLMRKLMNLINNLSLAEGIRLTGQILCAALGLQ